MQLRATGRLGWLLVALAAAGCHRLAIAGATVPTATLTGTVVAPLPALAATPQTALGADAARTMPVSYATVQALDGRLQPIAGVPEARTDAGGHFALDVPAGRPYVLRVALGDPAHPVDLLAVADPSIGDGAQLITVDAAMHVATHLLLDRTDGLDAALQSVGASDVQALVDAVRKTLSGKTMDLSSTKSMDQIARQEEHNGDVEDVLSRVDQATSQAQASASARSLFVSTASDLVPVAVMATSDATADVAALPVPAPSPSPVSHPAVVAAPRTAQVVVQAPRSTNPDREALAWEREFSWPPGPQGDPFESAMSHAQVVLEPLPRALPGPARRVVRRPIAHLLQRPVQGRIQTRRIVRRKAPIRPRPPARPAVTVRSPIAPAPVRPVARVSVWERPLSAITRWLPAFHLPDLPF